MAVDAISPELAALESIWSPGLAAHPLLSTFACEKYLLTKNPEAFDSEQYYEFVRHYGDIYLFRNKLFLPLGLAFDHCIRKDAFLQLPSWAKEVALLHTVIISSKENVEPLWLPEMSINDLTRQIVETALSDIAIQRKTKAFDIRSFQQTWIEGTIRLARRSIVLFQMPFNAGWRARVNGQDAPTIKVDVGLLGIALPEGEHEIELNFRPPMLYAGGIISLLSGCVLAIIFLGRRLVFKGFQ